MTIEKLQVPLEKLVEQNRIRTARLRRAKIYSTNILSVNTNSISFLRLLVDCEPHRAVGLDEDLGFWHGETSRISKHLVELKFVERVKISKNEIYYRITERGLKLYELFKDDVKQKNEM